LGALEVFSQAKPPYHLRDETADVYFATRRKYKPASLKSSVRDCRNKFSGLRGGIEALVKGECAVLSS